MTKNPKAPGIPAPHRGIAIEDVSSWILRGGVLTAISVMLLGIAVSFLHGHASLDRMSTDGFEYRPAVIWTGILDLRGKSIIEAGIYLLVLTPILRVAASFVLFATEDRDWLYALITLTVLILTIAGLLWVG
jgi:uncharacterized membrane protein